MNIKEYIQSGIIESYVLGLAEADDRAKLERLLMQHPEIGEAIQAFELELEKLAFQNAVPATPGSKTNLFNQLGLEQNKEALKPNQGPRSIQFKKDRKTSLVKYLAVASAILFVISAAFNIYTYSKYAKLENENRKLTLHRDRLQANNTTIQTKLNELDQNVRLITGPYITKVILSGVPGKESNEAVVYWNKSNKNVCLVVNALPQAPNGKQYQLWALMDGKPIDAGVLGDCNTLCKLKNIQNAQAFAITLEKEGGSTEPTLEQLFVIGKI